MIFAFILAASGPAQYGASILAETPHAPAWEALGEEDAGKAWWDRNAIGKASIENLDYPTILMRMIVNDDHWLAELYVYQDVVAAIDCENGQIAEVDEVMNGQRVDDPWADVRPGPEFRPLRYQNTDQMKIMMQTVCGEDWTP